jgi:hypothetical protein
MAPILAPFQQTTIIVTGYTDNVPIGPELRAQGVDSNQQLSLNGRRLWQILSSRRGSIRPWFRRGALAMLTLSPLTIRHRGGPRTAASSLP